MSIDWPVAEIDPVVRLRALAAALPHALLRECVLDAPVQRVWDIVGDLEGGMPRFEGGVREIEIVRRQGERLELVSTSPLGLRMRFDAVLRPNWCVMHSRFADVGMAVTPVGDGSHTLFAHFEGSRVLSRLVRPLLRRNVEGDFERLAALLRRYED